MKEFPNDPTPLVGSATDVAPLGQTPCKPAHEQTAGEDPQLVDWPRMAGSSEFQALLSRKARLVVPATIFFLVYFFALPVLVGYAPKLMETKIWGGVNLAYAFALSQFVMAWTLAGIYLWVAGRFDQLAKRVISRFAPEERP